MSPPPVRVETNASRAPSGEYKGRDSSAGWETNRCASPPLAGTTQISPPETKAISGRVGHSVGSVRYGMPAAKVVAAAARKRATMRILEFIPYFIGCGRGGIFFHRKWVRFVS